MNGGKIAILLVLSIIVVSTLVQDADGLISTLTANRPKVKKPKKAGRRKATGMLFRGRRPEYKRPTNPISQNIRWRPMNGAMEGPYEIYNI